MRSKDGGTCRCRMGGAARCLAPPRNLKKRLALGHLISAWSYSESMRGGQPLSPTLRAFLSGWQPRQRRTLGMLNAVLVRLQAVANAHPDWEAYDLLTHLLAALHLVIENDRLTGGQTEDQIVADLMHLVALEHPEDDAATHRAVAEAVVDVLTNARNRRLRLRDRYMHAAAGVVEHREQSFTFVRAVGEEDSAQPTLRATPEAVNVFQNLYQFDPSDRAAAERYRSQRMLEREEYDEVLTSVERRATSVHGLRGELESLIRRIGYNVRDIDYASDIIPRLDEVIEVVVEQVSAEERFAEAIADLAHHSAPDLQRLRKIDSGLRGLIAALGELQSKALATRRKFEAEQDRQLFTYRRITINPQSQLLDPLLDVSPQAMMGLLTDPLARWLGARAPRVLNLGALVARTAPMDRSTYSQERGDPFNLGDRRGDEDTLTPRLLAAIGEVLASVARPVRLSELLATLRERSWDADVAAALPWALAVTIANAYGHTGRLVESAAGSGAFDHDRLVVVSNEELLGDNTPIGGDDVIVVPRNREDFP